MKKVIISLFLCFSSLFLWADELDNLTDSIISDFSQDIDSNRNGIGIGNFVYAEHNIGSSFSNYLSEKFSSSISKNKNFELIDRYKIDVIMEEAKLSLSGLIDDSTTVDIGELKGLQYLISGRYFDNETEVNLFVEFLNIETGEVEQKTEVSLPKSLIPFGVSIVPDNFQNALDVIDELAEVTNALNTDFVVKAWTARGVGGIYHDGENLVINFFSNRDCYIQIFHIDVKGEMQQIFPNQYYPDNYIKPKQIYKIPDDRYPFNFELEAPYGTEFIKIVASTTPMTKTFEAFTELGSVSGDFATRGLSVKQRKEQTAEVLLNYTIVE